MSIGPGSGKVPWCIAHSATLMFVLLWFFPWWGMGRVLAPLDILSDLLKPWRDGKTEVQVHNHFPSDAITQYLPYRLIAERSFREDGYVGWSDLTFGGTAQYANTMALYFDWTMQLHRWLDFWTAWHLGLIAQFLIAGSGMLVFLQSRGVSPPSATAAAVAFMGNFQFVAWIHHRWPLSTFCWMPWVLWAVMRWKDGRKGSWPWIPLFLGMAFMGSSLQYAAFVVAAVGALWLADLLRCWTTPARLAIRTGGYAGFGLLGTALAAVMFVPCISAYLDNLAAGHTRGGLGYPEGALQPFFNLLAYPMFAFPWVMGSPQSIDLWKVFKSDLFYVPFIGTVPAAMAFIALGRRAVTLEARLLVAIGLAVPLTPLVGPLYQRFFIVYIMGAVWAFAVLWDEPLDAWRRPARWAIVIVGMVLALWLAGSVVVWFADDRLRPFLERAIVSRSSDSQFGMFQDWIRSRAGHFLDEQRIWSPQSLPAAILLAASALLVWLRAFNRISRDASGWAISGLVFCELTLFGARWVTWSDPAAAYPELPETRFLREHVTDGGRVYVGSGEVARTPFPPNTLAPYGIPMIQGYDSVHPPSIWANEDFASDPLVLGDLAVQYRVADAAEPVNEPGWERAWASGTDIIYHNRAFVPRYRAHVPDSGWMTPVLEKETLNMRELRIPPGTDQLTVAENWNAGWFWQRGESEGGKVSRGEAGNIVVEIPSEPRESVVRMVFRPHYRIWPEVLSLAVLLSLAGAPFLASRRRHRIA